MNARIIYGKLDFNKVCHVNPQKIRYYQGKEFNKWNNSSRILEGEGDLSTKRFDDLLTVKAIQNRFKEGKKWKETEFYQLFLNFLSKGIKKWGYNNKEDLDRRVNKTESLYYQIRRNGYKSKIELNSSKKFLTKIKNLKSNKKIFDDILLAVGREGQLIFINGKHRLSIVKLLKIPKIPIIFVVRHKKWMEFRKNLIVFAKKYQGGKLTYRLTHPYLQDIPFKYGNLNFNLIKENLSISQGTLLDIGSNLGYFCHKFEDEGFDCYAVEENRLDLYFLRKLKEVENKKFNIIHEAIFEYSKNQELVFDVVLALNGFHKYLENKETFLDLINFLKRLKVKELFFGVYKYSKFGKKGGYRNYSSDERINFIIENSCLNNAIVIGKTEDGRALYKLTY